MTLDEYFDGNDRSRQLFEALHAVIKSVGTVEMRVTKSQIAFRRSKAFAWVWIPGKYLRGKIAPLVLSLSFRHKDKSPRLEGNRRAGARALHASPGVIFHP